jgi:N-acetylmuramoyl-L-alanine amidase
MLTIKQDFIPLDNFRRSGLSMSWDTITVHNTGNPKSNAKNERAWLTNPNNTGQASWHYVIFENEIIQAIPDKEVAWHAGDGRNGTGNRTSLSIEVCESGDFELTKKTAAEFIAMKLNEKGKDLGAVVQHFHWTKKDCPRLLRPIWSTFLHMIKSEMAPKISTWEAELERAVHFVREAGISDGSNPTGTVTRGQVFVMFKRLFDKLN